MYGVCNSLEIHEYVRNSPMLNVWWVLLHNEIIGPLHIGPVMVFVEINNYRHSLLGYAWTLWGHWNRQDWTSDWTANHFMPEGAPSHYHLEVRNALIARFPNGPIDSAAPFPNKTALPVWFSFYGTTLDLISWGYITNIVHKEKIKGTCVGTKK